MEYFLYKLQNSQNKMDKPKREIQVLSNFFKIDFGESVFQYRFEIISPTETQVREEILKKVLKANKDTLRRSFGDSFIFLNWSIYSTVHSENITLTHEDNKVEVVQSGKFSAQDDVSRNVLGRLLKMLQERVRLKKVGRKLFDPSKAAFVDQLEIWPGYSTALVQNANLSLLNIDTVNKVITNVCVLDVMGKIKSQNTGNLEDTLNAELQGKSVMTKYNRRIYRVDSVVLDKTSSDSFVTETGASTTFQEYYQ